MTAAAVLPEGYDRFRDALVIVDPGACNPSGVARSIHDACRQVIAEGGDQRADPAVRLMTAQLSELVGGHPAPADYAALFDACRARTRAGDGIAAIDRMA